MKILLAHSDPALAARVSIDLWRIIRPFEELKKHVDWQIDSVPYLLDSSKFEDGGKYPTAELVKEVEKLGKYDIVWTGYFPDAVLFDVMMFTHQKFGTKFVVDMDDDIYHLPKHNSFWQTGGYQGVKDIQYMIENAPYVVTSSENLKAEFEKHRDKVYLLPNYIGDDYKHKKFDNKDKIIIGYFGSITHKKDLQETGILEALERLMHKYKNVNVLTVGINIDYYLPKQRYIHHPGIAGHKWLSDVWPNINCDIAVAPLEDTQFNRCKTNIKWLETALIPAAFVGSDIPPYQGTVDNGKTGLLVRNNSEDWYEQLEKLVVDEAYRKQLTENAQTEVKKNWHIKDKWEVLKGIIEEINE